VDDTENHVDDTENQLSTLFEQAAAQIEPPVEDIIRISMLLGRRRRARRTAWAVAAAIGAVGLTAGAVVSVPRLGIGSEPAGNAAAAQPSADRSVRVLTPSATPSAGVPSSSSLAGTSATAVAPPSTGIVRSTPGSSTQSAAALLTQLVSGYGLHVVSQSSTPIGVADFVYDDGHGQSEVIASVETYSAQLKSENAFTCANFDSTDAKQRPAAAPAPSCTKVTAAGGHAEYVVVTADDGSGFYDYQVNLFPSDNVVVSLDAGNGVPQGATVDVTRTVPPLSLAEMEAIVADPAWLDYVNQGS
jgi:hypothetical protein